MSDTKWDWNFQYERGWEPRILGPYGSDSSYTPYSITQPNADGMFTVYTEGNEPTSHTSLREAKEEVMKRHADAMLKAREESPNDK